MQAIMATEWELQCHWMGGEDATLGILLTRLMSEVTALSQSISKG